MKRFLSVKEKTAFRTIDSLKAAYRQGFSRGLALGLVLLAAFIVLSGSLLYGQAAVDALFIGEKGNVGIGTREPKAELDVNGKVKVQELEVNGATTLGKTLTVAGNLEVAQNQAIKIGNAYLSSGGNYVHLANNEWYDGNKWHGTEPGARIQLDRQRISFHRHDGKGAHTESMTITENGNLGIGTTNPSSKLDVAGDINVNGNRISNYKGFPKADFEKKEKTSTDKRLIFEHSFGVIPSFVQVWVKSDGKKDDSGIYKKDKWRMAGVLSTWGDGGAYGTVAESIDESKIVVRTGDKALWHGHQGYDFFESGEVWVKAWK